MSWQHIYNYIQIHIYKCSNETTANKTKRQLTRQRAYNCIETIETVHSVGIALPFAWLSRNIVTYFVRVFVFRRLTRNTYICRIRLLCAANYYHSSMQYNNTPFYASTNV